MTSSFHPCFSRAEAVSRCVISAWSSSLDGRFLHPNRCILSNAVHWYIFDTVLGRAIMTYDHHGLAELINRCLHAEPKLTLTNLVRLTAVNRHIIECSIRRQYGKTFRELRSAVIFAAAQRLLSTQPHQENDRR